MSKISKSIFKGMKAFISFLLLYILLSNSIQAQVACSTCSANDFGFQRFYLGDANGTELTGSCTAGAVRTGNLWMQVTNNSTRYSLLVYYTIVEKNALTGDSKIVNVSNCLYNGVAIPNSLINLGTISWICGNSLTISNFQMHWKQQASLSCSYAAPKCLCVTTNIVLKAPLIANYSYIACNNGSSSAVNFTSSATGGAGPYAYSWNFGDGTTLP